jgi:UDP-N-acetylmuramate dehydrogenase
MTPQEPAMPPLQHLRSNRLSHYRTEHVFNSYTEVNSIEEFVALAKWAKENHRPFVVLGNGSNVLFTRKRIRTVVLKNNIPAALTELGPNTIEASSTLSVAKVLEWCERRNLDSFYYLASVPATIGGAIAMNAGRGIVFNKTIFDFVKSVSFIEDGEMKTWSKEEIPIEYRHTPFTGMTGRFIVSTVLEFPEVELEGRPGRERVQWAKENQDHSAPNCGSVFKLSDSRIMKRVQGYRIGKTSYSTKTLNWLLCNDRSPLPALLLIHLVRFIHWWKKRKAILEIILVK